MEGALQDLQLQTMAKRILEQSRYSRNTYKVKFPAGTVRFEDGDVFSCLGDATISPEMPCRSGTDPDPTENPGDSLWQIKAITITDKYTECLIGSSFFSIFDIYKNQLKRVSQAPVLTEMKNVETHPRVIAPSG